MKCINNSCFRNKNGEVTEMTMNTEFIQQSECTVTQTRTQNEGRAIHGANNDDSNNRNQNIMDDIKVEKNEINWNYNPVITDEFDIQFGEKNELTKSNINNKDYSFTSKKM